MFMLTEPNVSAFLTNPINKYNHIHSTNVQAIILLRSHKTECHSFYSQNVDIWAAVSSDKESIVHSSSELTMKCSLIKKCNKMSPQLLEELKYKCRLIFLDSWGDGEGHPVKTCSLKRKYLKGKRNFS